MKKKSLIVFVIFLISITSIISFKTIQKINANYKILKDSATENGYSISCSGDYVTITFSDVNGINSITYPESGITIYPNGKAMVAVDYKVEKNKQYIFSLKDKNNATSYASFVTPETHIELTQNKMNVDFDSLKSSITTQLQSNKIATNFINIGIGEQGYVSTEQQDMSTVFNSWGSFGDGNWSYNSSTKIISNSYNSTTFTGYYYPSGNYTDINLSFDAMTSDPDDDMIGAMIKFSKSSSNYSSYLLLLDRHDSSGYGVGNGANNGINKVLNSPLDIANFTKLSVNPSLRWTRSTWQNYKFVADKNSISAYLDGNLIASTTDASISSGSYGFLSYSQANTYFKNVVIQTFKENSLTDIVGKINWLNSSVNIVINFNNSSEPLLKDQSCVNTFNTNSIYYVGVTSSTNAQEVNTFVSNIGNRGKYIDSTDYNTSVTGIVNYLVSILQ